MIYDHEKKERANNGEVTYLPMPAPRPDISPMMLAYLHDRELSYQLARGNGWYPTLSKGARIVIPCVNSIGFHYWQARSMVNDPLRYDSPPIPRRDSIVMLWPQKQNPNALHTVVITEGPMKSLAAAEFYPSIATMGAAPSEEVLEHIKRKIIALGLTDVWIVPDLDAPEFIDNFRELNPKIVMPTCKDLDQMPRWEREKLLG